MELSPWVAVKVGGRPIRSIHAMVSEKCPQAGLRSSQNQPVDIVRSFVGVDGFKILGMPNDVAID